jgi:hypothetical protein
MREAAIDCWVLRMRRHGTRLPAYHVAQPVQVTLLCNNRYKEEDRFVVRLFHPGQLMDWSGELHDARLLGLKNGVYKFRGDEWDPTAKVHHLQTTVECLKRGHGSGARSAWNCQCLFDRSSAERICMRPNSQGQVFYPALSAPTSPPEVLGCSPLARSPGGCLRALRSHS